MFVVWFVARVRPIIGWANILADILTDTDIDKDKDNTPVDKCSSWPINLNRVTPRHHTL